MGIINEKRIRLMQTGKFSPFEGREEVFPVTGEYN